ncbi:MAG: dihydrolipoamide acyltransferase [Porphyromonadaceae bacterium]|nr:dihydrolipoamide acyltransferase [Porphyromonadaceae bacterium]
MNIKIGIKNERTFSVTSEMLASHVGSGSIDVFSTPTMIAEIERTAAQSVASLLDEGKTTVGTYISVNHTDATPEGMSITVRTELKAISDNGRFLTFEAEVFDQCGAIGNSTHTRAIVDSERFMTKVKGKR